MLRAWQQADEQFDESLGGGVPLAQIKRRDCAIIRGHLDHEQPFVAVEFPRL
jgi:hypothetical protein